MSMSNALVPLVPYQDMKAMARDIAASGLFGLKSEVQVLALMAVAQAENKHPATVARDFDIVNGRPAKKAEAMLRDFIAAGGKVEWHALTDESADATFSHPQGGSVRITWDIARARTAGLAGKDMYKKFPRQMLRSRVVSEGVRTVAPLATSGFYVPEEIRDMDEAPRMERPSAVQTAQIAPQSTNEPRADPSIVRAGDEAAAAGTAAYERWYRTQPRAVRETIREKHDAWWDHACAADEASLHEPGEAA